MSFKFPNALAIAIVLIAVPSSGLAQTGDEQSRQAAESASSPSSATQEAAKKMVSAEAVFTTEIDSRKTQPGAEFQAKLLKKVRLENGPELPVGTLLVGKIVSDDTQSAGLAKLALKFTQANLKNGQTVPIRATIVNVYNVPDSIEASQYGAAAVSESWDHQTTAIDQIDVLSGVDLHSSIGSSNSGVFVSTKKNDIKLSKSVGVELAMAPQAADQASSGGE
jgi:hypothetical protein